MIHLFVRHAKRLAASAAGLVVLVLLIAIGRCIETLKRLFPTTAQGIQVRKRRAAKSAERFVKGQVKLIGLSQPPVVEEGCDLGCTIHPLEWIGSNHSYTCTYTYVVYALADDDAAQRVARLAGAIQAAGWSFARRTIGSPPRAWTSRDRYDAHQRDPSLFLGPIEFQRPDVPRDLRFNLDLVTSEDAAHGGRNRFQLAVIERCGERLRSGWFLYGYCIEFTYARGHCYLCRSGQEGSLDPYC